MEQQIEQVKASQRKLREASDAIGRAIQAIDALKEGVDIAPDSKPDTAPLKRIEGDLWKRLQADAKYLRELQVDASREG